MESISFVHLNFSDTFPHVFWVSNVGRDEDSPEGFRYKALTMRREPEMIIELIILRESIDGTKNKILHMQAPISHFEGTDEIVKKLGAEQSLTFQQFDFSDIRTFEEFRSKAIEVGWEVTNDS